MNRNFEMKAKFYPYSCLFAIAIILGYGLVSQVKIRSKIQEMIDPKKSAVIALRVGELIKNNRELLSEQKELQDQMDKLASRTTSQKEAGIQQEINRLKIIAGVTSVQGPGVEIKFRQPLETVQLVDLINALRNIGAEAISINGKRIDGRTGIKQTDFSAPYSILVIGESHVLENALTRRGGIIEQIGGTASVVIKTNLEIPAK